MKNKIIQNKNFIKILILFTVSSLIITSVSSVLVTRRVSKILIEKSVEEANYSLDQAYNTTYAVLTGIYGDYYDLWEKDLNIEKLRKGLVQREDLDVLKLNLENQVIRNGYVDDIYIHSKKKQDIH